jgi:hypothetical protein
LLQNDAMLEKRRIIFVYSRITQYRRRLPHTSQRILSYEILGLHSEALSSIVGGALNTPSQP